MSQPLRMKHFQPTVVSPQGAKITLGSFLNVAAMLDHIFGEWSSSGASGWYVALYLPGAPQISDTSAYMPVPMQQIDVVDDRVSIVFAGVCRVHAVDIEPTVLVEENAHDVDVP